MTSSGIQIRLQISCLAVLLALTATAAGAQIQAPKKASFVLSADHTAYEASAPAKVAALVTIDPGWHVNGHKPTFEYLIPTVLDLELPAGWPQETVQYPPAEMQSFSFANQPLAVYDGDVVILANLSVPAGAAQGTYPVRASLRFQACNDSQCLPPVTAEAEVQLTVGPGGEPRNPDLFQQAAAVAAPPVPGGEEGAPAASAVEPAAGRDEEAGAARVPAAAWPASSCWPCWAG